MGEKAKSGKKTTSTKKTVKRTVKSTTLRGKVNANILNVRDTPSLVSNVIGKTYKNEIVEISSEMEDWYQIKYKGETAYCSSKFIDIVEDIVLGKITASVLNVRNQPNTGSVVLGKVVKGETVEILKEFTEWVKINYAGKEAYVYKKYVDLDYEEDDDTTTTVVSDKKYFYLRDDLAKIDLAPKKQIDLPTEYKPKVAAKTWNKYGNLIETISDELGFEVEAALAVLCVESGGEGFSNDKMIIRFENHVFDIYWGKKNPDEFEKYFDYNRKSRRDDHKFRDKPKGDWETCHTSQDMEWKVFEFARKLSEKEAIYSISLGAPQVMGFNYKMIGYSTPQEMFEYFNKDIRYHFMALFDFIQYKDERINYLKKKDFYSFAKEYNGTTAPKAYQEMIEEYYKICKKLL